MKRIMVVDDERPVVEGISLIVRRELAGEFEVAGTAVSGREAIEKIASLAPDIVLMDVRMPGLSGLDAIREMRARGATQAFILVTAYERFDIAREAVGLGVIDYLLKPVSKDSLALSLRAASELLDRRIEVERREIEHRDAEERMRGFVESSFLYAIALGVPTAADLPKYRTALGLQEKFAFAAIAAYLPAAGATHPEADVRAFHASFREALRYKTKVLTASVFAGYSLALVPIADPDEAPSSAALLESIAAEAYGAGNRGGALKLGFGSVMPLDSADISWSEALADLLGAGGGKYGSVRGDETEYNTGRRDRADEAGIEEKPFEDDENFLEAVKEGSPGRAGFDLERILAAEGFDSAERDRKENRAGLYRIIALLGEACRSLARRGLLDPPGWLSLLDMEGITAAWGSPVFTSVVRTRFATLSQAAGRAPRHSPPVAGAIAYVKESFGGALSLETAADSVGISPHRLSRLFVEETGKGFSDYLIEFRIGKAKEMLLEPSASVKAVSMACGYPDPNYFSRLFKKVTGCTPTAFSLGTAEGSDGTV
ncbi:MAG: helix-turn-helix domain-containing protein [Rectinemataceae bacterium]